MTLASALEDIQQNTLAAVRGLLRKLEYLAQLQDNKGGYLHWGMSRVHGDSRAQQALGQAHHSVLSRVLSTPLRSLLEDVEQSGESAGLAPEAYAYRLAHRNPPMLPQHPGAGSEAHLKSVLHALLSLLKARNRDASLPTSWPPRQPGRSLLPPADSAKYEAPPGRADAESARSPHH